MYFLRGCQFLQSEHQIDGVVSRESAFLANNWLFAGITFATLWGTFFPMFSEILTGDRISVAAPWFNKVVGPLFLALVLLMGVGPLLGWRFTSPEALRRQFTWPGLFAIVIAALMFFVSTNIYPIIGMAICAFVASTIVQEYVRGILARRKHNNEAIPVAMGQLLRRNGRRYGGYIVHLGIVFIGVAVLGNEFFQQTTNVTLARGESVEIAGYSLVYTGLESTREGNHVSISTPLAVFNADTDKQLGMVYPQRNIYDKNQDMPTSEVGIRMTALEDVYVVINGWDNGGETATFTIFVNPLTVWMWIGGLVIVLGVLLAIWPSPTQRAQRVAQTTYVPVGAGD
ncbi:MAG: cytochrome c-type biogenesis CcmF C-terminal domain-containing protein [Caldilineaceae bacterium]